MKLGERLIKKALVDGEQINQALEIQKKTGGQLGDILLAITSMRAFDFYQELAKHFNLEFVNLVEGHFDEQCLNEADSQLYLEKMTLPVKKIKAIWTVATADPSPAIFAFIKNRWGENTQILCTSKFDILFVLQKRFNNNYLYDAVNSLIHNNAKLSSKYVLSRWQLLFFIFILSLSAYLIARDPIQFFIGVNIFLMASVGGIVFYKIILALATYLIAFRGNPPPLVDLAEDQLPIYSILVPLYKEKETTLRYLFINLQKLDYPKHLLDLKILVEQDDLETIAILKSLQLPSTYEFIYVPEGLPRTKAKACNFGLRFVQGEYTTLYDAEDRPDPLQLRKALRAFYQHKNERLACVQSRLNFYNSHDNWLTKMFTIEYTYWFDLLLPALEYLRTPIPLGGTSNHFKTAVLRDLHAWDPYNVTEDADLGVRLDRLGYTTRVIDSTTYEEANCHLLNWIRQRTRWIKGYIQTYLVHMRNPLQLWRTLGTRGFWGFQLFLGGTILTNFANLLLWLIFILSCFPRQTKLGFLFPPTIRDLATANFILGSLGIVFLNLLGVLRRKEYKLLLITLTCPFYWLLMSLASYRALYQLIFKASYWEKTEHGLSKTLN